MNKVELDKVFEELDLVSKYLDLIWLQLHNTKAYLEHLETSKIELFVKIVYGFQLLFLQLQNPLR